MQAAMSLDESPRAAAALPRTMKVITQDRYGGTDALEQREIDVPAIGDDEVLVRVEAAGLDRGVWHLMTGRPYLVRVMGFGFRGPKARALGLDLAGRVVAVGAKVTRFRVGDEVFGNGDGTFAEYAVARADKLAHKPAGLSFEQAAAVPTSAATARHALRAGAVTAGQRVLVVGASGGVGSFAVQLARALGAEVTGVASTSKLELVRAAGADHVLDYTRDDITRTDRPYDVILDIAGNRPVRHLRRALAPRGTLVIVGGENGGAIFGGMGRPIVASLLSRFRRQKVRMVFSEPDHRDFEALAAAADAGELAPILDTTFPLARAADAIRYLEQGKVRGKVVIVP